MDANELKACPFCGATACVDVDGYVFCGDGNCTMSVATITSRDWQKRTPSPAYAALVEAARRHVEACGYFKSRCIGADRVGTGNLLRDALDAFDNAERELRGGGA